MSHPVSYLSFVEHFVEAVITRPMLHDLLRTQRLAISNVRPIPHKVARLELALLAPEPRASSREPSPDLSSLSDAA